MNDAGLVGDVITQWFRRANNLKTIIFAVNVAHSRHIADEFVAPALPPSMSMDQRQPNSAMKFLAASPMAPRPSCRIAWCLLKDSTCRIFNA